jgi:hypothetical protein
VSADCLADAPRQKRGYSIANQAALFGAIAEKYKVISERLNSRAFSRGQAAVLSRVDREGVVAGH